MCSYLNYAMYRTYIQDIPLLYRSEAITQSEKKNRNRLLKKNEVIKRRHIYYNNSAALLTADTWWLLFRCTLKKLQVS